MKKYVTLCLSMVLAACAAQPVAAAEQKAQEMCEVIQESVGNFKGVTTLRRSWIDGNKLNCHLVHNDDSIGIQYAVSMDIDTKQANVTKIDAKTAWEKEQVELASKAKGVCRNPDLEDRFGTVIHANHMNYGKYVCVYQWIHTSTTVMVDTETGRWETL